MLTALKIPSNLTETHFRTSLSPLRYVSEGHEYLEYSQREIFNLEIPVEQNVWVENN